MENGNKFNVESRNILAFLPSSLPVFGEFRSVRSDLFGELNCGFLSLRRVGQLKIFSTVCCLYNK